jgi:hypothetical protein
MTRIKQATYMKLNLLNFLGKTKFELMRILHEDEAVTCRE